MNARELEGLLKIQEWVTALIDADAVATANRESQERHFTVHERLAALESSQSVSDRIAIARIGTLELNVELLRTRTQTLEREVIALRGRIDTYQRASHPLWTAPYAIPCTTTTGTSDPTGGA